MTVSGFERSSTILLAIFLLLTGAAWVQEKKEAAGKKLQLKDLPKPVQETIQQESKGGTVVGLSKEVQKGKTLFEAELQVNGLSKDLLIDANGTVIEAENQLDLTSLPEPLQGEIKRSIGSAKVLRLESLTRGGKLAGYEAQVELGGKKSEISMGPDGKRLARGNQ